MRLEVDSGDRALNAMHVFIEQFVVSRRDVPCFDFAAQILVEHWREKEVVFVADERYVRGSGQFEGSKKPPKPPPRITILGFVICRDSTQTAKRQELILKRVVV